ALPGAHQPEPGFEGGTRDLAGAPAADDARRDDPRRGAVAQHLDSLEAPRVEAGERGGHRCRRADDLPAVLRRIGVVWVLDPLQPGLRARAYEGVLDVLRVTAGGREVVGADGLLSVGDDPVRGRLDGLVARRRLASLPLIHLASRVVVDVEAA